MSTNTIYDVAVIGTGLMGSAATRYLSNSGLKILAIGAPEPTVMPDKHDGVFASHYDSGRLTHEASTSPIWSELAKRSLAIYRDLEAETGIDFYDEAGLLYIADTEKVRPYVEVCKARSVHIEKLDVQERFSTMGAFEGLEGWLEPSNAGHINPRTMLQAQLKAAKAKGATIIADTVLDVSKEQDAYTIKTKSENYQANKILFATGSYAKASPLFSKEVSIRVKNESIILAEISETEAQRLVGLPSVIIDIETEHFDDFYLVPPVRYPNGKLYLKMGSNTIDDKNLESFEEIQNWMRFESNDNLKEPYVNTLKEFFPNIQIKNSIMNRCIVTYSSHGNPYVDTLGNDLFLCTAGNGSGAKSADAIGELAANLILNNAWTDTFFKASDFAV